MAGVFLKSRSFIQIFLTKFREVCTVQSEKYGLFNPERTTFRLRAGAQAQAQAHDDEEEKEGEGEADGLIATRRLDESFLLMLFFAGVTICKHVQSIEVGIGEWDSIIELHPKCHFVECRNLKGLTFVWATDVGGGPLTESDIGNLERIVEKFKTGWERQKFWRDGMYWMKRTDR